MAEARKRILIAGASSGIGRACALLLAEQGHTVAVAARRVRLLKEIKKKYPDRIFFQRIDITNRNTALRRYHELIQAMGGCDIYIHSSGVGYIESSLNWMPEKETLETNIRAFTSSMVFMYRFFCKQGYGHIAAITSVAGIRANRYAPVYSATKAYQIALLDALRMRAEYEKSGVLITDLRPGFVDTAMAAGDKLFWVTSPEKAARQIIHALWRKKKVAYIPRRWILIAWLMRILPRRIYRNL